ncbi:MAG: DNA cytosine methyltransferase [Candidatus Thiodiazotropha sp.]
MSVIIQRKLDRIRAGGAPRVLDLFAGCGGISLGFKSAGFDIVGALEIDPPAARSHALNFHRDASDEMRAVHERPRDITITEPADLLKEYGLGGRADSHVDVIVGGPPCQAFARVGRAKLREVAEHPEAFLKDPRGDLYLRYLHYVKELRPVALLMENVPDVLNYGGHNIAEEVCEALDDLGYDARYTMMNAVFYGVPEMRERMFLVAFRKEFEAEDWFPVPTHWIALPQGYHGSRQVAMKTIKMDLLEEDGRFFVDPPEPEPEGLVLAVTAEQALSDLPPFRADSPQKQSKGPRRFDQCVKYPSKRTLNEYQTLMREWPGFSAGEGIYDHVIRYLPRDYKIFARMNPGDQYPEAYALANRMFEERLAQIESETGRRPKKGSKQYETLQAEYVPPYDPGKFPNKWRKMEADRPARTLMAHLGKDSYSHIHYDSVQARTISVREAARLQSFPDGFVFQGPMNPAFRQIGNAVPPLMAWAIANKMYQSMLCTAGGELVGEEVCIEEACAI